MRALPLLAALLLAPPLVAGLPTSPARAQAPAAQVRVRIGAELAAKAQRYGPRELDYLSKDLADSVRGAAAKGGFTRLDLVLEDARPNRPTFAMLGRTPSLSLNSIAIGGAKITGTAYGPGGARPLKSAWYETDLTQEHGAGTWSDAERAFQMLAAALAHGRVPQRYDPGTPGPERGPVDLRDPWLREN